jgi:hypothetical protein
VRWRTDYKRARAEAVAERRLLLLLLRSRHCLWCDRLEAAMAADAELCRLLADRVIPLKLYVERERPLFDARRVEVFPTTVLLLLQGFQEAAVLRRALRAALDGGKAAPAEAAPVCRGRAAAARVRGAEAT